MIQKKSDDAVSPVIGVMLMIVIVVIIAAVVTAFATGMMSETEAAPVAALDVEILNSAATLSDLNGPELFITHRSGDAVDTKDIELQFSWVCGVADCTYGGVHSSTYSADGFKEAYPNGMNNRYQALYVKSTMVPERTEYGSGTTGPLDHYFGDVILTPGLKLTASSEFLPEYEKNTASPFMEMVFNNYDDSIEEKGEETITFGSLRTYKSHNKMCDICNSINPAAKDMKAKEFKTWLNENNPNCQNKIEADKKTCLTCKTHSVNDCKPENYEILKCACAEVSIVPGTEYTTSIMDHLPAGTAVDVMIIHTPSGKAIYDKTVIVE